MWLNKKEISKWAYNYCRKIENNPEIRKNITEPYYAYQYCLINDDPEVRKNINDPFWSNNIKYNSRGKKFLIKLWNKLCG